MFDFYKMDGLICNCAVSTDLPSFLIFTKQQHPYFDQEGGDSLSGVEKPGHRVGHAYGVQQAGQVGGHLLGGHLGQRRNVLLQCVQVSHVVRRFVLAERRPVVQVLPSLVDNKRLYQ